MKLKEIMHCITHKVHSKPHASHMSAISVVPSIEPGAHHSLEPNTRHHFPEWVSQHQTEWGIRRPYHGSKSPDLWSSPTAL